MSCAKTMPVDPADDSGDDGFTLSNVGIFDLALAEPVPAGWYRSIPLVFPAMAGTMAYIGQYRPSDASALFEALAPLPAVWPG
jgi:hypothetical protein